MFFRRHSSLLTTNALGVALTLIITVSVGGQKSEPQPLGRAATVKAYARLMRAAKNGDVRSVRRLLKIGVNVNAKNADGWTALMVATERGRYDVVKTLLSAGADPNIVTISRHGVVDTPLGCAIRARIENRIEVVDALIAAGADLNPEGGVSPLLFAVQKPDLEMINVLIARGANVNLKNSRGITALMAAALNNDAPVVKALIGYGADVNARDEDGMTALLLSAYNGSVDVVRTLLAEGADVNAKNQSGETALSIAKERNRDDIFRILQQAGSRQ